MADLPAPPDDEAPSRRELIVGVALPSLLLLAMIAPAGIWDPYELNVADLARRAAVARLGDASLAWPSADNRLPTLGDVGHNELPLMAVAGAFRLLGLGAVSGRLPIALGAVVGLVVLWAWLRRMASARAGTYAAWALVTMPLYFVQARTMIGDALTMAAQILAFAGLSIPLLDPRASTRTRAAWFALGALGLVVGFFTRGALLGVAVPALAVGATWVLAASNEPARDDEPGLSWTGHSGIAATLLLVGGSASAAWAIDALGRTTPTQFFRALGSSAVTGQRYPTFDAVLSQLGPGLFPWSAFVPLALGRLLIGPPLAASPDRATSSRRLRALVLIGASLAYLAHGWIAPRTGLVPFAAVGLFATAVGLTLADIERGAHASRAFALVASLLAGLWMLDLRRTPEHALSMFSLSSTALPESFRAPGDTLVIAATVLFVALLALGLLPGPEEPPAHDRWLSRWTGLDDARALGRTLATLWQGNLAFVAVMLEAMLCGLGVLLLAAERLGWRLSLTASLPGSLRAALQHAWWAAPLALGAGVVAALTARRVSSRLMARWRWPRAQVVALAGVGAGLVMSLGYYPLLAGQLSPRHIFDAFKAMAAPSEPLGLLGVASRSASYYTRAETHAFTDTPAAFHWLTEGTDRRWLAVRADELPRLNSLYRALGIEARTPDHNLPVLDARSSHLLLVSNTPGTQPDHNPFAPFVTSLPVHPQVSRTANLEDSLEAIGWSLHDGDDGAMMPFAVPGRPYVLRFYWRVLATPTTTWRSFIHIDGFGRRHNGDHDVLGGKYPMSLWQPGDIITDRYELRLEPNFTPGDYQLFHGFFTGERRMQVLRGAHSDNRLDGGAFPVR